MVAGQSEHNLQADIIFVIEGTAINGAYLNDIKTNYVIPTLEYFSHGTIDDRDYIAESTSTRYGLVVYHAADCLPQPSSDCYGSYSSPHRLLSVLDRLELVGGKGESHANVAEGLATALLCFEDLQQRREPSVLPQKHCILVCNSPPYLLPVMEAQAFAGLAVEQLAALLQERGIHLSIVSPRKIPALFKLFEKAGGDLASSQTKNYAKDPRHLVLLKGYSLKERPLSPPVSTMNQHPPIPSLPSPLPSIGSPMGTGTTAGAPQAPQAAPGSNTPVFRPNQPNTGMVMQRPFAQQPPGYHPSMMGPGRPPQRWPMMPPQSQPTPRGFLPPGGAQPTQQGTPSALITQLQQPPSTANNQFTQGNTAVVLPQQTMRLTNMVSPQQQQQQQQQPVSMPPQNQPIPGGTVGQAVAPQQPQQPQQAAGTTVRERHTIWQGVLEWIEKAKNPNDLQKVTRHVPCQVSANPKDGEPDLKADSWPQKLIMQLMPKQLIGNIGGAYLKNSKSVLFHPQPCEALESLTRVMSSGFAGCVHFTSVPSPTACDIKVLILLYTSEKRAYLGFIPNDQAAFVDRLRKVIQHQKTTQALIRQQQPGGGGMPGNPAAVGPMSATQQPMGGPGAGTQQGGIMMSQTNPMAMGGGQITQNVVNTGVGSNPPNLQHAVGQPGPPGGQAQMRGTQGVMGGPPQRPPFDHIEAARQQNLSKIQQLRQTLEAAQQQELQYKSQLEIINHMKIQQLQQNLEVAQQQEMQYKAQMEQEQQKQLRAQLQQMTQQRQMAPQGMQQGQPQPNQQQARMMRPNNPGLRHLLQQQPQYRTQVLGMSQLGPRAQTAPVNNQAQQGQQQPQQQQQQQQQQQFDDVSSFDFLN